MDYGRYAHVKLSFSKIDEIVEYLGKRMDTQAKSRLRLYSII